MTPLSPEMQEAIKAFNGRREAAKNDLAEGASKVDVLDRHHHVAVKDVHLPDTADIYDKICKENGLEPTEHKGRPDYYPPVYITASFAESLDNLSAIQWQYLICLLLQAKVLAKDDTLEGLVSAFCHALSVQCGLTYESVLTKFKSALTHGHFGAPYALVGYFVSLLTQEEKDKYANWLVENQQMECGGLFMANSLEWINRCADGFANGLGPQIWNHCLQRIAEMPLECPHSEPWETVVEQYLVALRPAIYQMAACGIQYHNTHLYKLLTFVKEVLLCPLSPEMLTFVATTVGTNVQTIPKNIETVEEFYSFFSVKSFNGAVCAKGEKLNLPNGKTPKFSSTALMLLALMSKQKLDTFLFCFGWFCNYVGMKFPGADFSVETATTFLKMLLAYRTDKRDEWQSAFDAVMPYQGYLVLARNQELIASSGMPDTLRALSALPPRKQNTPRHKKVEQPSPSNGTGVSRTRTRTRTRTRKPKANVESK